MVANLLRRLEQQGPTVALVGEVNTTIGGWLVKHIKQEDTKLAAYLKSNS